MAQVILKHFHARLQGVEYTRKRMEKLFKQTHVKRRDVETVYEAAFLRSITAFEQFCESLFFAIVERKFTHKNRLVVPLLQCDSRAVLRRILHRHEDYLNWIPYPSTVKRAELYLDGGLPFSSLDSGDLSTLQAITTIRNAIAHRSKHAIKKFQRQLIINNQSLLPTERSPAGFLRSKIQQGMTRFQYYNQILRDVSERIHG